jgi:hypothetical protein
MKIFAVDGTETQTAKEKAIELVYTVIGIIQYDENIRVPNYLIPISSRRFALAMVYQARTEIKKQGLCCDEFWFQVEIEIEKLIFELRNKGDKW